MAIWERQWVFMQVFLPTVVALYLASIWCWVITVLSVTVVALFITDILFKTYDEFWVTRQLIGGGDYKKAVVITGCDTGFGNQLAIRLANYGYRVYAACLLPEGPDAEVLRATPRVTVLKMDVTKQEDIDEAFVKVKEDLKKNSLQLWAIVNNAGIAITGEVEFVSMAAYRRIMEVNTFGPVMVTKTFLPLLRAEGRGRVVNVASQAGRFTMNGFSAYSMSKHALVSFSDGLRLDMKKWNITVHTIEPALYKTRIADPTAARAKFAAIWADAPQEVQEAYGRAYYDAYSDCSLRSLAEARPESKLYEVIDDLMDAVAGESPKVSYSPSTKTKVLTRILRQMPFEVMDKFFLRPYEATVALLAARTATQSKLPQN